MKPRCVSLLCAGLLWAGASTLRAEEFDSAGMNIHYTVTGQGDPVVLIHGLYASAGISWDLPGTTALLAKDHRVVALDCRGHGQSEKPEAEGSYGTNMVEDVVRLLDHLQIARARVAGYSMGGMITMKLLALHPERVTAAVLAGMGWHRTDAPMNRFGEAARGRGLLNVPAACLHGFPALAVTEAEVKAIKIPVTVVIGDRDPCRRLYVEPLEKIRPDWPVQIVPNAGHLDCIVKPEFKDRLEAALAPGPAPPTPALSPSRPALSAALPNPYGTEADQPDRPGPLRRRLLRQNFRERGQFETRS